MTTMEEARFSQSLAFSFLFYDFTTLHFFDVESVFTHPNHSQDGNFTSVPEAGLWRRSRVFPSWEATLCIHL